MALLDVLVIYISDSRSIIFKHLLETKLLRAVKSHVFKLHVRILAYAREIIRHFLVIALQLNILDKFVIIVSTIYNN